MSSKWPGWDSTPSHLAGPHSSSSTQDTFVSQERVSALIGLLGRLTGGGDA